MLATEPETYNARELTQGLFAASGSESRPGGRDSHGGPVEGVVCRRRESSAAVEQRPHSPTALTDEELVTRARDGDSEAFGVLVERHHEACLKRALSLVRNRSDAEDEVQNARWKAFRSLDQYRGQGTFPAWLCRIVQNQCLMRIREARQAQFVYLDKLTDSKSRMELVEQHAGPEDKLGNEQVYELLHREIQRIPPLLRNVMVLRDVEQLPIPEVAARLGLSVPATKSRLMRARIEMRSRLQKYCGSKGQATLAAQERYNAAEYTFAS